MHNPHKLSTDSNKNTKNIKIANLCGKICDKRTPVKHAKYAAIVYSRKTDMPSYTCI